MNLEQLLILICKAEANRDNVTIDNIVEALGRRSFGPLLLMAGIIVVTPLSGIPGLATVMGIFVLVIAAQLLLHRREFWLPRFILRRSVSSDNLEKAMRWLQKPAHFIDRFLRPRLTFLVTGLSLHVIAVICMAIAAGMPLMEFVPFTSSGAGATLAAFGLALTAHDGLLALVAYIFTGITVYFVFAKLIF